MMVRSPLVRSSLGKSKVGWRGNNEIREHAADYRDGAGQADSRSGARGGSTTARSVDGSEVHTDPSQEALGDRPCHEGEVHRLIKSLHTLGNKVRLRYIDALRTLHDGRLYLLLGRPSFHAYCQEELGLPRSTAYEYIRAATALDVLPTLRIMFDDGELSWPQVREITRIASAHTELQWIRYAVEHSPLELRAEVRSAQMTGRETPGESGLGLPNLLMEVKFKVTLEENELIRAACAMVNEEWGDDAAHNAAQHPLVRLAEAVVAGVIQAAPPTGSRPASATAACVTYRVCQSCQSATVDTPEGPVSVAPGRISQVEEWAHTSEIDPAQELPVDDLPPGEADRPTPEWLKNKVLHRDGHRCTNPGCRSHRNLHVHHLRFRSRGGATCLANLTTVCATCHALIHNGLLDVRRGPEGELEWKAKPRNLGVKLRDAASLLSRLSDLEEQVSTEWPLVGTRLHPAPGHPGRLCSLKVSRGDSVDFKLVSEAESP